MEPPNRTNWIWSFETRPADLFPTLRAVGHPTSLFQPHKTILMHTLSDQLLESFSSVLVFILISQPNWQSHLKDQSNDIS